MGERLIQQRRGRGGRFRAPSHRYVGQVSLPIPTKEKIRGEVLDIINSVGHSAPLMYIEYETGDSALMPAPIGIKVGDTVYTGDEPEVKAGTVAKLSDIPTGTEIFGIERIPFSNSKLVHAGGSAAKLIAKEKQSVTIELPSKKKLDLNPMCRAVIGRIAGGGRNEKPFMKAGNKFKARKAKNKLFPRTSGVAMSDYSHPFGGTHRRTKGRPMTTSRTAPPGRKVGHIAAKRTGKRKKQNGKRIHIQRKKL